jgi:NAD(P)H-hydrate epimerase
MTCAQVRAFDRRAIEMLNLPGIVLMENAGRTAAEFIYDELPDPARSNVVILCGPGNNGGDGFVIARHLQNAGVGVTVALAMPPERSTGDAATNLRIYEHLGGRLIDASLPDSAPRFEPALRRGATAIVDALLGTGAGGAPRGRIAELIRLANSISARRIAVDVPSGLDADSGAVADPCFQADLTITFVAAKVGFSTPTSEAVLGRVIVAGIGVPRYPSRAEKKSGAGLDS